MRFGRYSGGRRRPYRSADRPEGPEFRGERRAYLSRALIERYASGSGAGLDAYPEKALARVWKAVRFSWWMTQTLHRFPESSGFDRTVQAAELEYLFSSKAAQTALAENSVRVPYREADGVPSASRRRGGGRSSQAARGIRQRRSALDPRVREHDRLDPSLVSGYREKANRLLNISKLAECCLMLDRAHMLDTIGYLAREDRFAPNSLIRSKSRE